jgi:hypothetical protein
MALIAWLFTVFFVLFLIAVTLDVILVLVIKALPWLVIAAGIWVAYRLFRRWTR